MKSVAIWRGGEGGGGGTMMLHLEMGMCSASGHCKRADLKRCMPSLFSAEPGVTQYFS